MLSEDQVSFLKDKDYFLTKQNTDNQLNSLLYSTQQALLFNWNSKKEWNIPEEASNVPGKIIKGLNHKGFPYQVFDFPAIFNKKDIFTFRVVVWYGNQISVNLILSGKYFSAFKDTLHKLYGKKANILLSENIWETDILDLNSIEISEANEDEIQRFLKENKSIRLFRLFKMNQINEINRFTVECFNDWFSK